ncbi:MAG: UDP-glucose 6-dehydrogenase, partial [Actinobacteria bacterium]|nr:UDP-glucose 6-dehydrogenase [Actinomycetota bacterium]
MRIAVAGLGYVGLAQAVLLAQRHEVVALDVDAGRVGMVNDRRSPIEDADLEEYLATRHLDLRATMDPAEAFAGADFVVIATPTNYDSEADFFDTSTVEEVIGQVEETSPSSVVVV